MSFRAELIGALAIASPLARHLLPLVERVALSQGLPTTGKGLKAQQKHFAPA
jgi:hypothetical protein